MEQHSTGLSYLTTFIAEAVRSLQGRIVNFGRLQPVNTVLARQFFERRSATGSVSARSDIIESGSGPYKKLQSCAFVQSVVKSLDTNAVVLDYGCGDAKLYSHLRAMGFTARYVGYDIDRIAIARLQTGRRDPQTHFMSVFDKEIRFNLIFACNVFVYAQDDVVLDSLARLRKQSSQNATIIIMEPYPAWYWEFCFEGIRLCPRTPEHMCNLACDAGWTPCIRSNVSLLVLAGHVWCPTAYCVSGT